MLHKRGLHIPDAAKNASMQMYSSLSSALLWKVLLQVQSCISSFLRWKLLTYLKEMSFLCWVLSPRIMQIDKFLTLLLCVDYNSSYFWGVVIEENCDFCHCQILFCLAPCGASAQMGIGYCQAILLFHVYLFSVHSSGPCSPDASFPCHSQLVPSTSP